METSFPSDEIIQGYVNAFQSLDGSRVASFYSVPCLSVRGDGSVHVFSERPEIDVFFAEVLEEYSREGMVSFTAADVVIVAVGGNSYRLECTWFMKRSDGSVIKNWEQTYIFLRTELEWKIAVSIIH